MLTLADWFRGLLGNQEEQPADYSQQGNAGSRDYGRIAEEIRASLGMDPAPPEVKGRMAEAARYAQGHSPDPVSEAARIAQQTLSDARPSLPLNGLHVGSLVDNTEADLQKARQKFARALAWLRAQGRLKTKDSPAAPIQLPQ